MLVIIKNDDLVISIEPMIKSFSNLRLFDSSDLG